MMSQVTASKERNRTNSPLTVTSDQEEYSFIEALTLGNREAGYGSLKDTLKPLPSSSLQTMGTIRRQPATTPLSLWPTSPNLPPPTPPAKNLAAPNSLAVRPSSSEGSMVRPSLASSTSSGPTFAKKGSRVQLAAISKAQRQCLDTCRQANKLGDRASVLLLQYLTSVKHVSLSLSRLAHRFLEVARILITIAAGLDSPAQAFRSFPSELLSELERKIRAAIADFSLTEQAMSKSLENERKSGVGRMFRKVFGDTDFEKLIQALTKTKESLQLSSLMFQWTVGDERVQDGQGIGYAGLAAALDMLDNKTMPPPHQAHPPNQDHSAFRQMDFAATNSTVDFQHDTVREANRDYVAAQLSPGYPSERASTTYRYDNHMYHHEPKEDQLHELRLHSATGSSSGSIRRASSPPNHLHEPVSTIDETMSQASSANLADDILLYEVAGQTVDPSKPLRIEVSPSEMARWSPRNEVAEFATVSQKNTLFSAIRSKNHQLVEQLLDRGVSPNTGPEMSALKEAVMLHDAESVRLLLLFGAQPDELDRSGVTPLLAAVSKSFFKGAMLLLQYGANPNLQSGPEPESPLLKAVTNHMMSFVHLCFLYGGDANHIAADGNTLLICSISKRSPRRLVELILVYGAAANEKSRDGKTALFQAVQTAARADLVGTLLEHGANPNLPGPKHPLWPATYEPACLQVLLEHGADYKKAPGLMELAASLNNIESVRILLKAGVDPNAKKDGVYTPLCTSIRDNRPEIFQLLLSNGANPNVMASEYPAFKCLTHNRNQFLVPLVAAGADLHTPKGIVETAVASNNMDGLVWLLDKGLSPNDRNPKGHSPLTTAIREGNMEMVQMLLSRGADPNMRGQDWPICMAVHNPTILKSLLSTLAEPRAFKGVVEKAVVADQLESVKLLLGAGVSVEDKNGGVFSPLTTALREDRRDIVRYLLNEGGADVNAPGEHLPIVKALRRFHDDTEMLELLLKKGADPNKIYRGWNAIMQAVENGDLAVLQLVAERSKGVDLEKRDDQNRTVIDIASSRNWNEAVQLMTKLRLR